MEKANLEPKNWTMRGEVTSLFLIFFFGTLIVVLCMLWYPCIFLWITYINYGFRQQVTAERRPKNSALEVDLDFEHNVRPPPVITEEVTASIEDIIQKRIEQVNNNFNRYAPGLYFHVVFSYLKCYVQSSAISNEPHFHQSPLLEAFSHFILITMD